MNPKRSIGFTLIEILLVIGVIMIMSIIKIRDINEETENMQSKMLASQIKTVADATNAFLVLKYNELSVLSSPGVSCNTGAETCNITLQNLSDEALLPPNFNNNTILGNPYEIQLKRTGFAPNYMMSGVVLTKGIKNTENTPSLVFLGKVLRDIGRDGGLNKTSGKIIGTANGWSADSALFPVLSGKTGYIGSAVGTLSGAYYVYLRRDGTLPMTGDLNMDGHNIQNVNNLTATGEIKTNGNIVSGNDVISNGNISAKGNINAGNWLSAKNKAGNKVMIGGDETGDYDIVFDPTTSGNNVVGFFSSGSSTPFDFNFRGNLNALNAKGTQQGVSMNGTTGDITASGDIKGNTLLANSTVLYGDSCDKVGAISKDSSGNPLICSSNNKWIKSNSVIETFNRDFYTTLPLQTSGLDVPCIGTADTGSQQQYTFSISPIQNEAIFISFTGSLSSSSNPPTANTADSRISTLLAGTGCIYINNILCTGLSNIGIGRTGSMSCIKELIGGQTYNFRFVLGNNYDSTVRSRAFIIQYLRTAR